MYLLKPEDVLIYSFTYSFTFHYVSIKTSLCLLLYSCNHNLHSTMYLLKHLQSDVSLKDILYLHSTMYLLKPIDILCASISILFTFHYVSIKTYGHSSYFQNYNNLHSTMYLLKLTSNIIFKIINPIYIPLCIY